MGKKLYEPTEEGGIQFKSERQSGEVRVPNYVYDIWMPLIGAEAVGLYSVYCRLEREGVVKGMTLVELANACRIGKASLMAQNERLQECGFLKLAQPDGKKRLMHFTTEITVLDPPQQIPAEIIAKYQPNRGYEPLTPWLVNGEGEEPEEEPPEVDELDEGQPELPEVPTRTSGGSNQNHAEGIGRTAKIADPLVLQPSDVGPEDGALPRAPAPDPPPETPAKKGKRKPDERLKHPALIAFRDVVHSWPVAAARDAIITTVGETPADVTFWQEVVTDWMQTSGNPRNITRMLDCFREGRVLSESYRSRASPNGKRTSRAADMIRRTDEAAEQFLAEDADG